MQGAKQKIVDKTAFPEAHLVLSRMHVHVDTGGIHFEVQHIGWMPPVK